MYSCLFTPICMRNHVIFHTNTLNVFEYYIRILSSKVFTKIDLMITNKSVSISGLVGYLDNFLLTGRPWIMIARARTSHEMRSVASLPGKSRQLHYIVPLHWKGKKKQRIGFHGASRSIADLTRMWCQPLQDNFNNNLTLTPPPSFTKKKRNNLPEHSSIVNKYSI